MMGVETVTRTRTNGVLWLVLALLASPVLAGPQGEQVVSGEATFTRDGDLTVINTSTPQTIVHYLGGFDIAVHETVSINQPDALSNILNYDLSSDPTSIQGRLFSNGGVWIVNPVGVFFGDQAIVDVGRLVAGAGGVADEDFLAGVERLTDLSGSVEVASGAQIRAADSVLLAGAAVANYGNISAADGMIALVAGGEVRLARVDGRVFVTADRAVAPDPERWAVVQAGTLDAGRGSVSLTAGDAYSLALNHTGITRAREIHVEGGDDGLVEVAGTLDASSDAAGETGGRIAVLGDRVLLGAAALDASGAAGGGEILVGGDYQGGGDVRTARRTVVSPDAVLRADAGSDGDGGRIIVWADEATHFYGTLSARGGSDGGDGGFAEISGAQSLVSRGAIDLGASAGRAGTLLYDPKDIVIAGGDQDGSDDPDPSADLLAGSSLGQVLFGDASELATPFTIYESEIEGTNANVVLEATNSITATGTFDHVASGEATGVVRITDGNSLAMRTRNDAGDEVGGAAAPGINLTGVSFLASGGGGVTLATGSGDLTVGDITTRGADGATGGAGGAVALLASGTGTLLAGDIDASGGSGSAGDGGAGGQVVLGAIAGPITVGRIDVSGGIGANGGRGGNGGTINLVADLDPDATAPVVPDGIERTITVTGDLLARGGDGSGSASDAGAGGGTGGQIFLSAGLLAGKGSVVLGSSGTVRLDASGGDGTAGGGSAGDSDDASVFSDAAIGAIRIEAHDDVTAHADLVATGGDTDPSVGPGGFGGLGGEISIESEAGDVALNDTGAAFIVTTDGGAGGIDPEDVLDANGVAQFDGQGGSAGSFTALVSGPGSGIDVLGGVSAQGGAGTEGAGGAGGTVTLTAADGAITVSDVDVSGGSGTGSVTTAEGALESQGVHGGNGGNVTVTTRAGTGDTAVGGGDVRLGGSIVSLGGAGVADPDGPVDQDPNENHGVGGTVRVTSVQDIAAAGAADANIQAGTIRLTGRNVFAGVSADLVLASSENTSPDAFDSNATVEAGGDIRVLLDDTERFARFELIQSSAAGAVDVLRGDGTTSIAHADGAGSVHTIQQLDTISGDPHFTYRFADPPVTTPSEGDVDQIDVTTLAVASDAVHLGANGGKIANARADAADPDEEVLLGRIQGEGAGPHVTTVGPLELFATNIGDVTPLAVDGAAGAAPSVELTVGGDARLDVGGTVALVDLTQRRAAGDVAIDLPGGGLVTIDGSVVDTGSSRIEATRITRVDTTPGNTDFFFHLADASASSDETSRGEPVLTVASGAVTLDADTAAGFATRGDLVLEGGAQPAIDAGGGAVVLLADTNLDGTGAIVASGSGTPDVANAALLVAFAGSGVGSEDAPLRTSADPTSQELLLAGRAGTGDFQLTNDSGDLVLNPLAPVINADEPDEILIGGVQANGDVVLDNGGRDIVMRAPHLDFAVGEEPPLEPVDVVPVTSPHVRSGGSQRYAGAVRLENPRRFATTSVDPDTGDSTTVITELHEVRLEAGGDVVFEGDVDTTPELVASGRTGSLAVDAGGTITFLGNVGSDAGGTPTVDALNVTDVRFTEGIHTVTVASADFDRIDGPGSLVLRGRGPDSLLEFRDDVGAAQPLASFDADADLLVFGSSADRIVAGSVRLNAETPTTAAPDAATIADTSGGLTIESASDVEIGAGEKLSVVGGLAIHAGGTATVSDLAATDLRVDASRIVIQGRNPGPVALPDGSVVQDYGVDWAANEIVTNVVPGWDGVGTRPTFVLGSGGILMPGAVPFDVIRFTPDLDRISAASFAGSGRQLDLTGLGPRAVSDASNDVPRAGSAVRPFLEARATDTPPAAPPEVSGEEVLRAVRCTSPDVGACPPAAIGDGMLGSERTREIVSRYHELLVSPQGRQRLVAAFDAVGRAPLARTPAQTLDGRSLYRSLATTSDFGEARQRVDELAVVLAQLSLLGLDEENNDRVRRAVAGDFAAATGVAGLDAGAVLDAVAASGVAVLP